ncbi:MAG: SIMPL domain-containing protein [Pseudomonadota bacterium]
MPFFPSQSCLAVLGFLTGLLATAPPALAQLADPQQRFIAVTGSATIDAPPDIARVSVGVITQKRDAAAAMEENAKAMQALFAVLAEVGIAPRDIQTTQLSLYPVWERDAPHDRAAEISAYRVQHGVTVTLREIAMLGPLLDRLVKGGARDITHIGFGFSDPEALRVAAREAAMADAIARAELFARMAGATLGPVLTIEEVAADNAAYVARVVASAEGVPVAPGEADISASVSVVFALE